jgi:glucan 1,4-alpha-glucosidase
VFNISLKPWKPNNQINTTLAQQLAIYVVIYSPIQMACDLPEYYEGKPAFQFIRDVGTDWEKSITLNGEIGDFITKAREEKGTGNWFIGGITDENARDITIDFSFLPRDVAFNAIVYTDGKDAHYKNYPTSISIEKTVINSTTNRIFHLAPGGGFAISLIK